MGKLVDRWLGRASGVWTFLGSAAPGTIGAIVSGALSQGSAWIAQFGWLGWWCAFLAGGFAVQMLAFLFATFRVRMAQAKAVERWAQLTDNINPLDDQFYRKRIQVTELAHPVTKLISGKTFTQCELFGPGNLYMSGCSIDNVHFKECDIMIVKDDAEIGNISVLYKCHIVGGEVWRTAIFMTQEGFDMMASAMGNLKSQTYEKPTQ